MYGNILITDAGKAAVATAVEQGSVVTLSTAKFANGKYTPSATQTDIQGTLIKSISTISGDSIGGDNIIHINVRDSSSDAYDLYEIGIFTSTGVLFAICSQNNPILQKSATSQAYVSLEFSLENINPASVTLGDTDFLNPSATETQEGVMEIATQFDVAAGVRHDAAVTPKTFIATKATTSQYGVTKIATNAEVAAGSLTNVVVTPKSLMDTKANQSQYGVSKYATTAEVIAGDSLYLAVSPSTLVGAFQKSHSSSGYQRLPSGLFIQWGLANVPSGSLGVDIYFPSAFKNNAASIAVTGVGTQSAVNFYVSSAATGKFNVRSNGNGNAAIFWIAIGY